MDNLKEFLDSWRKEEARVGYEMGAKLAGEHIATFEKSLIDFFKLHGPIKCLLTVDAYIESDGVMVLRYRDFVG